MASLAEREALRGKVQCIYFDPPYGIKFNSNWQVSTLSRDVKDGKQTDISREPEQIKAFRDTWKEGIHSYLTYLRDRLTVARELLTESGSIFVQIGDENVHRVRAVMDEVFGAENVITSITVVKTAGATSEFLAGVSDTILWFGRNRQQVKFRPSFNLKEVGGAGGGQYTWVQDAPFSRRRLSKDELSDGEPSSKDGRVYRLDNITSQGVGREKGEGAASWFPVEICGRVVRPSERVRWKTNESGMQRLRNAERLELVGNTLTYVRFIDDFRVYPRNNLWTDTGISGFGDEKMYVVQTLPRIVERCILMSSDPGDLVLDPTCGSGTTGHVAEQWGRRWITIDTSRVALALARTRLMSARYPYYLLADSLDGRRKEQEIAGKILADAPTHHDIRQGFVYERAPHVTLKSIANNSEIDVIYDKWQSKLEPLRAALNAALGKAFEDWHIPRDADPKWPAAAKQAHAQWWEGRIARQKEIDASIARAADVELLYDRPYEDKSKVRVAGPFTVESLSPHRVVPADQEELIDLIDADDGARRRLHKVTPPTDFSALVLESLKAAGVHQSEKRDTIRFTALTPWPGEYVAAEGRFMEGETERRAAIFIGPEFGTLTRVDLVAGAREAMDARFDVLIACAFAFDAHASEITKLGPLPILKAKMNPDLHMAGDLKTTGKGNLFVVFGEPDIEIEHGKDGQIKVRVKGVDVYDPNTGEIRSNDVKGIAAWFIDDDYNEESFFVRHAYFLGANDPYKSLKTALRAEIDEEAWATLYRAESRPFARPKTGKIAVKVINHFGDEVMKVYRV
jgi:adenine-specific DNA-methyltransferase